MRHAWSMAVAVLALGASGALAQGHEEKTLDPEMQLGTVHFATSCRPDAAAEFDRAVAMLHSFGYEMARQTFAAVAVRDPGCAMAHWGIAMTYFHPLWAPPPPTELEAGRLAAERAAAIGGPNERERGYIEAIGTFYRDAGRLDHRARAVAYRDAMAGLVHRFPDDREAAIFYALALLGSAPPSDGSLAQQKQAAEILNGLLPLEPDHPGIAHYLIHALDYPQLADLGVAAARVYARIAPASPHALHMPSHIFTRLGLWEDSIRSNLASEATANALVARSHPGAASYNAMHALDYLEYAYLQTGQDAKAREVLERVSRATTFDDPTFAAGYALAAIPARYALERRQWRDAARLAAPDARMPWRDFPYALALTHFARAIGGARSGDLAVAADGVARLAAIRDELARTPPGGPYDWAGEVESLRLAASGWLAHARGEEEQAAALMRSAAELQDRVGKHPVTPGELLPARELLGDLLAEQHRPREAVVAYDAALQTAPNRLNALVGAALAAEQAGDATKAAAYFTRVAALCASADPVRPEIVRARAAARPPSARRTAAD